MIPVRNNEDIIGEVIEYLVSQGIELVVLDNGSIDKTYEICKKYVGRGILKLSNYKSEVFRISINLRMLYDMALVHSPDWVIKNDSDEFLESGMPNTNLKDAIEQIDSEGYNLIQFERFDFFMTDDDNESAKSIKEKFKYYSYQGDFVYRAWKYFPGIRNEDVAGHYPIFPDGHKYKILPKKFVMRHYPIRNGNQANQKVTDLTRGYKINLKKNSGINLHIKKLLNQDLSKKIDHRLVTKYNEDEKWNYDIKLNPYDTTPPPKQDEIITKDGDLKVKQKTIYEYNVLLAEKQSKWLVRKILKKIMSMKKN